MATDGVEVDFQAALQAHGAGRLEEAAGAYRRLLEAHPDHLPAWVNLGQIFRRSGRVEQAIGCYRAALAHGAADAAVYFNLANALRDARRPGEALEAYDRALAIAPDLAQAHCGRGIVLRALERVDAALAALREAVRLDQRLWRAWQEIGAIRSASGQRDAAARAWRRALALNPRSLRLLTWLAELDWAAGRHVEAIAALRRAVEFYPERADVRVNLAVCLSEVWQLGEALTCCEKALALEPDSAGALLTAGKVLVYRGEIAAGLHHLERALALQDSDEARRSRAFASLYDQRLSAAETAAIQRDSVRDWPCAGAPEPANRQRQQFGRERLTLVYLSPDLHGDHPVAQFMAPVLAAHDRERFQVIVLHAHPGLDDVSRRLAADTDRWIDVSAMDDGQVAETVRELAADVLIDLAGHTARSRLKVLGLRPAAVQISFLGFPFTTGFDAVDYLVADPVVCPPEQAALYRERLLRLPHCVFCLPELGELPPATRRADAGSVVFGNFGNLSKLSDGCIGLWARVLQAVPQGRLLLKAGGLADQATCTRVAERFAAAGIGGERLILRGPSPFCDMLDEYRDVDAILDTRPYNGGTTTFHALAMGVPVLTLPGQAFYGRMGASILTALGRPEWIAASEQAFVEIAAKLATDLQGLRDGRLELRRQLQTGPLADHAGYVRSLERLLESAVDA